VAAFLTSCSAIKTTICQSAQGSCMIETAVQAASGPAGRVEPTCSTVCVEASEPLCSRLCGSSGNSMHGGFECPIYPNGPT